MYADRYSRPHRFNPAGLTAAIAINAAAIAALIFATPTIVTKIPKGPLKIVDIFMPEPPPPEPVPQPPENPAPNRPTERVDAPVPPLPVPPDSTVPVPDAPPLPPAGPLIGKDIGPLVKADPAPPPPLPTLVDATFDPRYMRDVQPVYPASERRAEREGRVTIRVLVGVDGRVRQAERVSATNDAFWQATLERALSKWRFKPATRGGIPVEAWRTLTLTFVLEN
jgi:periplasmic protein TonB